MSDATEERFDFEEREKIEGYTEDAVAHPLDRDWETR